MYSIYHIPSQDKIGCTNNLVHRVEEQQGLSKDDYEVLFTTKDIVEASNKEIELQSKYNYKIDKFKYKTIMEQKQFFIAAKTVTLKGSTYENIEDYKLPESIIIRDDEYKLTELVVNWIKNNTHKSKLNNERFFYIESFKKAYKTMSKMNKNIFEDIREWAKVRGIYEKGDPKTQYIKLQEETGEIAKAILKNDMPEIIDGIGDAVVVLTNLAELVGVKIEDCIDAAYNEIANRKGKMVNGTFEKEQ